MEKQYQLVINGQEKNVRQISIPLPCIDPLRWLESQKLYPKIFWHCQNEQITIAGVGSAMTLDAVPCFEKDSNMTLRFFGGYSFSNKTWKGFPLAFFFLPKIQIIQTQSSTELLLTSIDGQFLNLDEVKRFCADLPLKDSDQKNAVLPPFLNRKDKPLFAQWQTQVSNYLKLIENHMIEKIVCARRSTFICGQKIPPFLVLKKLKTVAKRATLFAFQLHPDSTFLGASPERLYKRVGRYIQSDVLAGTRPKGSTPEEDEIFKADLLLNPKERREFLVVKQSIYNSLKELCSELREESSDQILTTTSVHHLYNCWHGTLKETINDEQIIKALHPTPAMGGSPREKVLDLLDREETFVRGWYAAPVGWMSPTQARLIVAIRSALIENEKIHLFSGAGIVQDSIPQKEWEELDHKIKAFTEVFL